MLNDNLKNKEIDNKEIDDVTICLSKELLKKYDIIEEIKKKIIEKENKKINSWYFLEEEEENPFEKEKILE